MNPSKQQDAKAAHTNQLRLFMQTRNKLKRRWWAKLNQQEQKEEKASPFIPAGLWGRRVVCAARPRTDHRHRASSSRGVWEKTPSLQETKLLTRHSHLPEHTPQTKPRAAERPDLHSKERWFLSSPSALASGFAFPLLMCLESQHVQCVLSVENDQPTIGTVRLFLSEAFPPRAAVCRVVLPETTRYLAAGEQSRSKLTNFLRNVRSRLGAWWEGKLAENTRPPPCSPGSTHVRTQARWA